MSVAATNLTKPHLTRARRIALAILAVVGLCILSAFAFFHRADPPGTWSRPPIYPSAQNVAVDTSDQIGKQLDFYHQLQHVTTFSTADSIEQISQFYRTAFDNRSWQSTLPGAIGNNPPPQLTYLWFAPQRSGPMYTLDVYVKATDTGSTQVEIDSSYFPGY